MPIHHFIAPMIAGSSAQGGAGYVPAGAIWLDGSADYLTRTPSSTGSPKTQTFSVWVKKGTYTASSTNNTLFGSFADASNYSYIGLDGGGNGKQRHNVQIGGVNVGDVVKTGLDRDLTAWFHLVVVFDITNITSGDRIRVYQNGVRQTAFSTETYPSTTDTPQWSTSGTQEIISSLNGYHYFKGYMAEFIRLDGYAGTADDFGKFDSNGNWVPIDPTSVVTANKGTNGFWLDFANSADLGNDVSGNGNDFTPTSMSSANATLNRPADDADNNVGNYGHANALNKLGNTATMTTTPVQGGMLVTGNGGVVSSIATSSGKWYCEFYIVGSGSNYPIPGVTRANIYENGWWLPGVNIRSGDGYISQYPFHTPSIAYGSSYTAGDIIMLALDQDNGAVWFGKNGTWFNSATTSEIEAGTTTNAASDSGDWSQLNDGTPLVIGLATYSTGGGTGWMIVEPDAFTYTPPTGFKALSTANLSAPTVTDPSAYFNTVLYTGNGSTQAITGVGFQPDLVWLKCRDTAFNHQLMDAVRGASSVLASNLTDAASTSEMDSFDSDGFTLTHNPAIGRANVNTKTFVAWCLKAGGAGSSNTDGSISSTVSVASHGGFSIGTFTGTGANATVGHGLSSAPEFVIFKNRSAATSWQSWHSGLTAGDYTIYLDSTQAQSDQTGFAWQSTPPSSSVITLGTQSGANGSGNSMVFYAFAKTPGLIGIGSYVGNGSADGPYVVVDDGASGFRPAFVMVKNIADGYAWHIHNSVVDPYNPTDSGLNANDTGAEASAIGYDFTANGFKLRTSNGGYNLNAGSFIYLAFAEYPFGGDTISQARAR